MKSKFNLMLVFFLLTFLISCQPNNNNSNNNNNNNGDEKMIVSTIKSYSNGKKYIELDGKPFLAIGAQIRLDGLTNRGQGANQPPVEAPKPISISELEPYIKKAKEMGFTVLQIPIEWSKIEISKDNFDFTFVSNLLNLINKYDIKMELLWFSTNMVGDTHSFHLPNYIWHDNDSYPKMSFKGLNNNDIYSNFNWMYGDVGYLVLDNENLLKRETNAINKLMDYIYNWNLLNDNKKPIIGIQVHNEPDGLLRWRYQQKELHLNGQRVSQERLWEMTLNALNITGMAFKNSNYSVFTRVNLTVTKGIKKFPEASFASPIDVYNLEGIDIVGDDPYIDEPNLIKEIISDYNFGNNFPHIAENMGEYSSTPQLILNTYVAGGSYNIYDFATPKFFVWMNNYFNSEYQMDQGIIYSDLSYKPHTKLTVDIINAINISSHIFLSDKYQVDSFNTNAKEIPITYEKEFTLNNMDIKLSTNNQAIGFIAVDTNYIYVYTNNESILDYEHLKPYFETGYFNNNEFIVEEKLFHTGAKIKTVPNKLNRFPLL